MECAPGAGLERTTIIDGRIWQQLGIVPGGVSSCSVGKTVYQAYTACAMQIHCSARAGFQVISGLQDSRLRALLNCNLLSALQGLLAFRCVSKIIVYWSRDADSSCIHPAQVICSEQRGRFLRRPFSRPLPVPWAPQQVDQRSHCGSFGFPPLPNIRRSLFQRQSIA